MRYATSSYSTQQSIDSKDMDKKSTKKLEKYLFQDYFHPQKPTRRTYYFTFLIEGSSK
jgi:hypothetical protein